MHLLCVTLQPKKILKKLEQIQKRAARFITNEYSHLTRVTPRVFHMQGQMRTNTLSSRVALEHGMGCLIRPGKPIT